MYILKKSEKVINVDNESDLNKMLSSGWEQLSTQEIKAAGMEGYEKYVSPLNASIDDNGRITFTPPSKEELDAYLAGEIRDERNMKLAETDYLVSGDYPISAEKLEEVKAYRKALRDIPEQDGFPKTVDWPVKPEL